jgi:hypothetical protein
MGSLVSIQHWLYGGMADYVLKPLAARVTGDAKRSYSTYCYQPWF